MPYSSYWCSVIMAMLSDDVANDVTIICCISSHSVRLSLTFWSVYKRAQQRSLIGQCYKARFPLPELTARVDGWPVSITRQLGPSTRVVETGLNSNTIISNRRRDGWYWYPRTLGPSPWQPVPFMCEPLLTSAQLARLGDADTHRNNAVGFKRRFVSSLWSSNQQK